MNIRTIKHKHLVIGTGAAGYNAAARLHRFGEKDVAIIAENRTSGTSRNTGSDKQTYYKLSIAGSDGDSVRALAEDLFAGGCVDGDIALCEAALSLQGFYHLVELGVPFPCNEYGEYAGYKTDHDRGRRATSVGPYTSKLMTEYLEAEVLERGVKLYDKMQAVRILTAAAASVSDDDGDGGAKVSDSDGMAGSDKAQGSVVKGVLCLDLEESAAKGEACYVIFSADDVILATGGPAGMYHDSVYPASQIGSSGIAFEAGVRGKNLTEWQFGMASLTPRWNVSGTYMQVLPRVVSTDAEGEDEKEFLMEYFDDAAEMLSLLFLKGYQWPFDVNKIYGGSSMIDLLVYRETVLRGRRVFLDYRTNPLGAEIPYERLSAESREYLAAAGACFGTPIERLAQMNEPAIAFYREHGVDLYREMLEIAVCAQHNNGGLAADANWETDVTGLFAVGEVCGSHGVTRPGGSALNAGQVGSYRAADAIAHGGIVKETGIAEETCPEGICTAEGTGIAKEISPEEICAEQIEQAVSFPAQCRGDRPLNEIWTQAQKRMSRYGGMIRDLAGLETALSETEEVLADLTDILKKPEPSQLGAYYHLRDLLISQKVYLSAMADYVKAGGRSRGSALYTDPIGEKSGEKMPELFRCRLDAGEHSKVIQEIALQDGSCETSWRDIRPIPEPDYFFENVWRAYRKRRGL